MATETKPGRNGRADTMPPTDAPAAPVTPNLESELDAMFLKATNRKPRIRVKLGEKTYGVSGTVGVAAYTKEAVVAAARAGVKTSVTFLGGKVREGGEMSGDNAETLAGKLLEIA